MSPNKHACIPAVTSTLEVLLRAHGIGFFNEFFHLVKAGGFPSRNLSTKLQVTKAG
jgi:hypothetical protein